MIRSPHGVTQPLHIPVYQCKAQHQKVPENSPGPTLGRVAIGDRGRGEKSVVLFNCELACSLHKVNSVIAKLCGNGCVLIRR